MQNIVGKMTFIGTSDVTLAKKYEEHSYIPLLISLRKTGRSSGKTKMNDCTVKKAFEMRIKKRPPLRVAVP